LVKKQVGCNNLHIIHVAMKLASEKQVGCNNLHIIHVAMKLASEKQWSHEPGNSQRNRPE
jgi:hypothetical protein